MALQMQQHTVVLQPQQDQMYQVITLQLQSVEIHRLYNKQQNLCSTLQQLRVLQADLHAQLEM